MNLEYPEGNSRTNFLQVEVIDTCCKTNKINQNPYFGCFEILSLFYGILFLFSIIVLGVLSSFLLLFRGFILFPLILKLCLGCK